MKLTLIDYLVNGEHVFSWTFLSSLEKNCDSVFGVGGNLSIQFVSFFAVWFPRETSFLSMFLPIKINKIICISDIFMQA